jgi:hypothetical protein
MKQRLSARLAALCGLVWALAPQAALAADRACSAMDIESDDALHERWPDLVARVRDDLLTRDDLDACARVSLSLQRDAAIGVTVALPDGRSASRTALNQDDVVPTLQALLLVPKHTLAASEARRTETVSQPLNRRSTPEVARTKARTRAAAPVAAEGGTALGALSSDPPTGLGVELSVMSGARIGNGQASFALGAMSFLDFSGWLLGFEGRADKYHVLATGDANTALELGALLGKRIRFPSVTLDVMAGPGVAMKGAMSDSEVVAVEMPPSSAPPPARPEPSSGPVPRLLVAARLGFRPRSAFRTFVGLEGTFGPERAVGNTSPESPRLPHWTLGLALGATLGTR